jgi:hypothetical protein
MSDEKLALVLFDIGFALMLVSMVIGPFGIENWAVTTASIACCLALGVIVIAFQGWDGQPGENPTESRTDAPRDERKNGQ